MKRFLAAALVMWLAMAQPALALSNITGFNNRNTGDTITASIWNTEIGGIYTYINSTVIATLNSVLSKGRIFTSDGTNITTLDNAGAGDNGKVLTLDSAQTSGVKWAAPGGIGYTTTGDMSYYNGGNQRLGIGSTGQILTVSGGLPSWAANTSNIPAGLIAIWPGSIASIPSGWALCDGQNGTPNMQGLMVVGAGNHSPAATGGFGLLAEGTVAGSTTHTHSFSDTSSINSTLTTFNNGSGSSVSVAANNHTHSVSGTTGSTSNRPASVAFAWIMKL